MEIERHGAGEAGRPPSAGTSTEASEGDKVLGPSSIAAETDSAESTDHFKDSTTAAVSAAAGNPAPSDPPQQPLKATEDSNEDHLTTAPAGRSPGPAGDAGTESNLPVEAARPAPKRRKPGPRSRTQYVRGGIGSSVSEDFQNLSDGHSLWYDCPDGWKRRIYKRTGKSVVKYDIYVFPPAGDGRKTRVLRSSLDILRYMNENPCVPIDPYAVNMDLDPAGCESRANSKTVKFAKAIEFIKASKDPVSEEQIHCLMNLNPGKKVKAAKPAAASKAAAPQPLRPFHPTNAQQNLALARRYLLDQPTPAWPKRTVLILEKLFLESVCMPTKKQFETWSRGLDLQPEEMSSWFHRRWKAKLRYEASQLEQKLHSSGVSTDVTLAAGLVVESASTEDVSLVTPRSLQRFDLLPGSAISDPLASEISEADFGEHFTIEYENSGEDEEDLANGDGTAGSYWGDGGGREGHGVNVDADDDNDENFSMVECDTLLVVEDDIILSPNPIQS